VLKPDIWGPTPPRAPCLHTVPEGHHLVSVRQSCRDPASHASAGLPAALQSDQNRIPSRRTPRCPQQCAHQAASRATGPVRALSAPGMTTSAFDDGAGPAGSEKLAFWHTERMVILGGPVCGLGLLACGAIALPPQAFGLTLIGREVTAITTAAGMAMFGLLALPLLYWVLIFIPLPDALYPRWARDVREDRRKFPQTNPSQPSHPRDQPDSEWR